MSRIWRVGEVGCGMGKTCVSGEGWVDPVEIYIFVWVLAGIAILIWDIVCCTYYRCGRLVRFMEGRVRQIHQTRKILEKDM